MYAQWDAFRKWCNTNPYPSHIVCLTGRTLWTITAVDLWQTCPFLRMLTLISSRCCWRSYASRSFSQVTWSFEKGRSVGKCISFSMAVSAWSHMTVKRSNLMTVVTSGVSLIWRIACSVKFVHAMMILYILEWLPLKSTDIYKKKHSYFVKCIIVPSILVN